MPTDRITGFVLAAPDPQELVTAFTELTGCVDDPTAPSTLRDPTTAHRVAFVKIDEPDPAMALNIETEDVEASGALLGKHGFTEHWSAERPDGTKFLMCRHRSGVFVLLSKPPESGTAPQ